MLTRPRVALGIVTAVTVLALLVWMHRSAPAPASAPAPERVASSATPASTAGAVRAPSAQRVAARAGQAAPIEVLRARLAHSSLRDTEPDGEIVLSADGRVRVDAALRRRFDHYLTLLGEFSSGEIGQLLHASVNDEHGASIAIEVAALFERYLAFREALSGLELAEDLGTRLAQVQELRRQWFGNDAEAMFGDEEAYTRHTLERMALLQDPALAPEQRARRLAELEVGQPPQQHTARQEASVALLAEEQTRQFEQLGVDAATRASERAALWGDEAAQRLAQLDDARTRWDRRVAEYLQARELVRQDPGLDASQREASLLALRQAGFDPHERQRIEALEAVGALVPGG